MSEKQRTLGDIANSGGTDVPVRDHPNDIVYCEDRKDYVNREDAQETSDGKFYSEDTVLNQCNECCNCITDDEYEDNDGFCEDCRAEREECVNCNDWHLSEDMRTCNNDDNWCESCHDDNFYFCQCCDDHYPHDECTSSDDGEIYCDACYSDNFNTCYSCNTEISNDDSFSAPDCETYCSDCHCEAWTCCEDCGDEISREDCNVTDDGEVYCEGCYTVDDEGRPQYNTPRQWTGSNVCTEMGSMRKFGIELELIDCDGYGSWIDKRVWGVKTDGSVSDGMEFVTAPIAGDEGLAAVRAFCANAEDNDFASGSNCGYHLHCDLTGSSPDERKSLALAYHYTCELWHDFIDRSRYDTSYSRLNSETRHDYPAYRGSPSGRARKTYWDRKSIIAGDGHPEITERYVWVNWQAYRTHNTVELRSHHPTCNGEVVTNWIKAHIKFIDFVSKLTIGQVTRTFGGNIKGKQMSEFRHIWGDSKLFDFYNKLYEERNSHCLV